MSKPSSETALEHRRISVRRRGARLDQREIGCLFPKHANTDRQACATIMVRPHTACMGLRKGTNLPPYGPSRESANENSCSGGNDGPVVDSGSRAGRRRRPMRGLRSSSNSSNGRKWSSSDATARPRPRKPIKGSKRARHRRQQRKSIRGENVRNADPSRPTRVPNPRARNSGRP